MSSRDPQGRRRLGRRSGVWDSYRSSRCTPRRGRRRAARPSAERRRRRRGACRPVTRPPRWRPSAAAATRSPPCALRLCGQVPLERLADRRRGARPRGARGRVLPDLVPAARRGLVRADRLRRRARRRPPPAEVACQRAAGRPTTASSSGSPPHGGHAVALASHSAPAPGVLRATTWCWSRRSPRSLVGSVWGRSSEQLLALAERRYRELIERLPVVTYLAEYGPAGKWLYVSPQIERLLGFPPEEWLVNRHFWWSRIHPDDRERVELEETSCAQTLEPLSIEYRMIARDDRVVWIRDEGALGAPGRGRQRRGSARGRAHRHHRAPPGRGGASPPRRPRRAHRARQPAPVHRGARAPPQRRRARGGGDRRRRRPQVLQRRARPRRGRFPAAGRGRVARSGPARPNEFLARFGGDEFALVLEAPTEEAVRPRLAALLRAVREHESRRPGAGERRGGPLRPGDRLDRRGADRRRRHRPARGEGARR